MTETTLPVQTDTEIARLQAALASKKQRIEHTKVEIRRVLGQRSTYSRSFEEQWPVSWDETLVQAQQVVSDDQDSLLKSALVGLLSRLTGYLVDQAGYQNALKPLYDVYDANQWSRFYIVVGGHIHSSMYCHTCFPTTRFGWLTDLSGLTEADAVAKEGPLLCSVCFPTAPVEWTLGKPKPEGCKGSGQSPVDGTRTRSRYGQCPVCGDRFHLTNVGVLRKHKPKEVV